MTTPRHVLLACELDGGARQAERVHGIAGGLAAVGMRVSLALRDGSILRPHAAAAGWAVATAPAWDAHPPPGFLAATYADLLLQSGYAAPDALRGLLARWQALLTAAAPDLVLADLAPTAMLAARIAGLEVAAIGDGYAIPPPTVPLPSLRPWDDLPPDLVADTEGRVLAIANAILPGFGGAPLGSLAALFDGRTYLCAFPELDPYEGRGDTVYYGEVFGGPLAGGVAPDWPNGAAERVFADLDLRHPAAATTIAALNVLGLPSVVRARAATPERAARLSLPHVRVVAERLDRLAMLSRCDIVLCQDAGTAVPALLAGRPVLLLPAHVEHLMTANRVVRQGLGHALPVDDDAAMVDAALRRLLDDAGCRRRVLNFARAYQGYAPALAIEAIARDCGAPARRDGAV